MLLLVAQCIVFTGCRSMRNAPPQPLANPIMLPPIDRDYMWDQIVDVVDDYFQIQSEDRVRLVGDVPTEGRIDTFPVIGSTVFEPWLHDSADSYEKVESTLQTIRRRCYVRVVPYPSGYSVEVAVFKELEDLPRPEHATAGSASFRNDSSIQRYTEPVGGQQPTLGWIPLGRDATLEARMLGQIQSRIGAGVMPPCPVPPH